MTSTPIDMPNAPSIGQLDTPSNGVTYQWDGTKWTSVAGSSTTGVPPVSIGSNPPSNADPGELWYNNVNGILYVWYVDADQQTALGQGQWVDVRPVDEDSPL
jgi:hypothetical protein